jgi:CheY-like chemotaxis protein
VFNQLRVLVVDDNCYMRRILEAMLEGYGCRDVLAASDGVSALGLIADLDPDLVIANINMPKLDGLELTRTIRDPSLSHNPFRPVILLSAYSDQQHVAAARNAGADEFLHKPVQPAGLYRAIVSVMQEPRSYVRTKTYFGPDRRRGTPRSDAPLNPGKKIRIGDHIVRDFTDVDLPSWKSGKLSTSDAA